MYYKFVVNVWIIYEGEEKELETANMHMESGPKRVTWGILFEIIYFCVRLHSMPINSYTSLVSSYDKR